MIQVVPIRNTRGQFTGYWTTTDSAEITPSYRTARKWADLENAAIAAAARRRAL